MGPCRGGGELKSTLNVQLGCGWLVISNHIKTRTQTMPMPGAYVAGKKGPDAGWEVSSTALPPPPPPALAPPLGSSPTSS